MKKIIYFLILFFTFNITANAQLFNHNNSSDILPPEQAFLLDDATIEKDVLILSWHIANNVFMYQDKFEIIPAENIKLGKTQYPIAETLLDENNEPYGVYYNSVSLKTDILSNYDYPLSLVVKYQACAVSGYCYPPQKKLLTIEHNNFIVADTDIVSNKMASPDSEQGYAESVLNKKSLFSAVIIFFAFGFALAFTPCVLPMIPILSSIIVGHRHQITTLKALALSLTYVLSMALTYAIAGVIAGLIGSSLQAATQNPIVITLFSLVFIFLALAQFQIINLQLPHSFSNKINAISSSLPGGHLLPVATMGFLAALIVSPCVTPALVGALSYIGHSGDAITGGITLFAMGLGMGVPLIFVGTLGGKYLPKAGHWMDIVANTFGVLMLGIAIWLLSRILPGSISLVLWAILAICVAVYLGALEQVQGSNWQKLWKGFGVFALLYGFILLIGALTGASSPLKPLNHINFINQAPIAKNTVNTVYNVEQLQSEIAKAQAQNKPIILDYYASWCVSCKIIENEVLSNPEIQAMLANFHFIKVDITNNDQPAKALLKANNVIAPPVFIFLTNKAKELESLRLVGEFDAKQLKVQLSQALSQNL